VVLAEAQTSGDGCYVCLNRGQKYGAPLGLSITTADKSHKQYCDIITTLPDQPLAL